MLATSALFVASEELRPAERESTLLVLGGQALPPSPDWPRESITAERFESQIGASRNIEAIFS